MSSAAQRRTGMRAAAARPGERLLALSSAPVAAAANRRSLTALTTAVAAAAALLGGVLGLLVGAAAGALLPGVAAGLVAGLLAGLLAAAAAPRAGERLALAAVRARPTGDDRSPRFTNLAEGLSQQLDLPSPRLYLVDSPAANAMALAGGKGAPALVVTTGFLERLNRVELEGVLAGQLARVRLGAAGLATAALALGGLPGLRWSAGRTGAATWLRPLAALLRLSAPARADRDGDEHGAYLTRYPPALVSALRKLGDDPDAGAVANLGLRYLWAVEPPLPEPPRWARRLPERPPVADRVATLEEL